MKSAKSSPHIRLAADIGGTFTDIAVFDERTGALTFGKALSTPQRLVDGIDKGVEKAGSDFRSARAVPAWLDGRDQHHPGAHRRQDRAADHRGLPRHLRDRPHQPARRLQPVLPQACAAGRAGAALRGEGARARGRRDRAAARRGRDRGARRASSRRSASRPAPSCSSTAMPAPSTRRAPRRSSRSAILRCSSPPRTSCRRNIASSSAARPSPPTPMSGPKVRRYVGEIDEHIRAGGLHRLVPDRAVDRRALRGRAGADPVRAHAGVGAGRGRDRHAGTLPHARHRQRHRLRHGRHHRQGRRDLQGRAA